MSWLTSILPLIQASQGGNAGPTWGGASASPVVGSGIAGLFSPGAGAGGLTGLMYGPAALGNSGLTSMVSAGGPGAGAMQSANLGAGLGEAPAGLFSGLLPGGGMSGTASGALGGGFSGAAAGAQGVGGTPAYSGLVGLGAGGMSPQMMQALLGSLQMQQQGQPQQQGEVSPLPQQVSYGNPAVRGQAIGQPMPYLTFDGARPFGFGGVPYV